MVKYILFVTLVLFALSCAKIGTTTGGPKDIDPPIVLMTKPAENSTEFIPEKQIEIEFNEYIALKDINQELILSPPLNESVITQMRGKSLFVEFPKNSQFDSTTYTLSFGKSITDNNEGNLLDNYEFVFSVKKYIDSLQVEGKVVSAFNHKADEDRMYVMLYKNLNDSAPLVEKPRYIARTDKSGKFSLHNLEAGTYRIFALKDGNYNYKYDLETEQIAFADSFLVLNPAQFTNNLIIQDSSLYESLSKGDTTKTDSVVNSLKTDEKLHYTLFTGLYFFLPQIKNQYMTNFSRPRPELLNFIFNEPVQDTFKLTPLNAVVTSDWFFFNGSRNSDTLNYWITDTTLFQSDSLQFQVNYNVWDSNGLVLPKVDTLWLVTKVEKENKPEKKQKVGEKDKKVPITNPGSKLLVGHNIKNAGAFDLNKNILIAIPSPFSRFDASRFHLYMLEDTNEIPLKFKIVPDSLSLFRFSIQFQSEEMISYKLLIRDSAIYDIYGATNDTLLVPFRTQAADFYGQLSLNISQVSNNLILQLLDSKENIVQQQYLNTDKTIRFEYLYPQKYLLKIIVDRNKNGKWDTGNYFEYIQPEEVIYFDNEVNVRSNWEVVLNWPVKN